MVLKRLSSRFVQILTVLEEKNTTPINKIIEFFFYLVDPASSHMLVSKIKPCKSKYKSFILRNCGKLIISVIVYLIVPYYLDNRSNSRANTCVNTLLG